ncbi:hypothetical protein V8F33_003736 [Rhypophila sp. PSN 637]
MTRPMQTATRQGKRTLSWTRFRLPPNQEGWPFLGSTAGDDTESQLVNPLQGVPGTSWNRHVILGKMVEDPQEAVCIIQWQFMDHLTNFIASPACDRFLRLLDGQSQHDAGDDSSTLNEAAAAAPADSSTQPDDPPVDNNEMEVITRRRRRFVVLKHWTEAATSDIKGRVTLSSFVMGVADDSFDTLYRTYQDAKETFGRPRNIGISGVWFYIPRSWSAAEEQEDMLETWLENTFGRGSGGASGSQPTRLAQSTSANASGQPKKGFMCEFNIWNDFPNESANVRREEDHAKDLEIKDRWDQMTGEWISDGRILSCRRERWDFEQVRGIQARDKEKKRKREEGVDTLEDTDSKKPTAEIRTEG